MHRFFAILFTLVTVAICGLLLPTGAIAQTNDSGVIIKQDGDAVMLIPREPGKAYLVLGYPRDGGPKGSPGQVSYLTKEQRISAKEFSKLVIFELALKEGAEVALEAGKTGLLPGKPCACDFPWPPPPECPGCAVSTFLLFPNQDPGASNRK
jgi:hypothetical protein